MLEDSTGAEVTIYGVGFKQTPGHMAAKERIRGHVHKTRRVITADLVIPESMPAPVSLPALAFAQTEIASGQEAPPPGQEKILGPEFGGAGNQVVRSMYVFSLKRPVPDR